MLKFAANLSWLFTELDFGDRFAAAAGAGFGGADVAERLTENSLELVLINAPPGDWGAGERGMGCLPGHRDEFRAALLMALDYASQTGCKRIHVMAGITPPDTDPAELQEIFTENLAVAAKMCGEAGVRVMIEPINSTDMPGYYLSSPDQAAALIDAVASPHLGLQFDVYHAAMSGLDIVSQIKSHFSVIGHFQIAGQPGRNEPVDCNIDYPALFDLIDGLGYEDWIGCEYRPAGKTKDGLGWARDYGISPGD